MNTRRYDWLPLASQQLRLRNLSRIQGRNIESHSDKEAVIYYTLHNTKECAPFYTSEVVPQRYQLQQKWAEINCPDMLKSNSNCVCVKVWTRLYHVNDSDYKTESAEDQLIKEEKRKKEPISALSKEFSNICLSPNNLPRPPDKLLFMWGVYFSGLIRLNQDPESKCRENSLIFTMNGYYFASPEHLTDESLNELFALNYERFFVRSARVCNPPPPTDKFSINSPQPSRSSSPVDLRRQHDALRNAKTRYVQLFCGHPEVRASYDLKRLLLIQELQRLQLQRIQETMEIATDIKHSSVHCITKEQTLRKHRTTSITATHSQHQHHSMGRTLSVLLTEQQEIDPHALLRAQLLQRQLETVRCNQRMLQTERKTYAARIELLRKRLRSLCLSRHELETWVCTQRSKLDDEKEELEEQYQQKISLLRAKRHIVQNVERRMSSLCIELRGIYPINRTQTSLHTICGIPFPYLSFDLSDIKYANNLSSETVSPNALSAALGYIAHLVQMIAVIINRPLRNPIITEGSRTRIMDVVKDIPLASREFPLYTRSSIPSQPVKYAIYLLNQNIAQLCFDITGVRCDLRATIDNILHIFAILAKIEEHQREIHGTTRTHPNNRLSLHSNNIIGDGKHLTHDSNDCLSKSHSSIDMNHMPVPLTNTPTPSTMTTLLQLPSSEPTPIAERSLPIQRTCRSVGSYSDCEEDFKSVMDHGYSNSDSNLTFQSGHV